MPVYVLFCRAMKTLRGLISRLPKGIIHKLSNPKMRTFYSLEEFDTFVSEVNSRGDEEEHIPILANAYLIDPTLKNMPSDPFSPEYHRAVLSVHARISCRPIYDAETMEHTPLDVEATIARPAPYQNGGEWLGNYFESFGHLIKRLDVRAGMRVIEYGCGEAEISLHLARLGCDVTVVDIEPSYIEIVKEKASRLRLPINTICGDFMTGSDLEPFDRVFFYQAFHHAVEHQLAVANLHRLLKPDGFIVFGPEPVIDPKGPWKQAVPYPWGPRLDGLSLRAMRTHGWMELGFQEPYFMELLTRNGWTYDKFQSTTNGLVFSIVAKRR
jgi:SAM-dependent methyltransferase